MKYLEWFASESDPLWIAIYIVIVACAAALVGLIVRDVGPWAWSLICRKARTSNEKKFAAISAREIFDLLPNDSWMPYSTILAKLRMRHAINAIINEREVKKHLNYLIEEFPVLYKERSETIQIVSKNIGTNTAFKRMSNDDWNEVLDRDPDPRNKLVAH